MKNLFAGLSIMFAWAAAAVTVSTDTTVGDADLATYTEADAIVIETGATLTFSGISSAFTLSAPISGAGTFKATSCNTISVKGDNSSFSGAFDFTDTAANILSATAFGSASVTFTADAKAVALTMKKSATLENAITIASKQDKDANYNIANDCVVSHTGIVTLSPGSGRVLLGTSGGGAVGTMVFSGTLKKPAVKQTVYLYCPVVFKPGVTLTNLGGSTYFYVNSYSVLKPELDIGGCFANGLSVVKGELDFGVANGYTSGILTCGSGSSPYGVVDLCGFDQTIATIQCPRGSSGKESSNNFIFTSDDPATLTVSSRFTTSSSGTTAAYARLNGKVSLVCGTDASAAICNLDNYGSNNTKASETDGSIIAYNGSVSLDANARLPNLSALVVTNQGSIAVANGENVNSDCELWLSGSGKLSIAADAALSVSHCRYIDADGVIHYLDAGSYAGSTGPAAEWLGDAGGTLVVKRGAPVEPVAVKDFHWNGSAGTAIATAENWNETGLDLSKGDANLHFNGGTENAAAETDAKVHGLDFSRATDFSFGGSGLVSVGEGGLSAVNADTAAHAITISAPLKVDSHAQSWTLGGLTTLMLNGDLSSLFTTEPLTVTGDGAANEIVLAGDNAALVPSLEFTGVSKVTVKSNTGLGGGDSATFNNVIPHFVDCESNGVAITVSAIDHDDKEPFFSNDSGSFVMTAPFTISAKGTSGSGYDARPYLHLENLDMTFAAGVTVGKCDRVFFNVSGARVHFKDSTIVKSGTGHIRLDGGVTTNSLIRIDRPMNLGSVKMVLYICRAAIVCGAPDIFASFDSDQQINMSASSMGADSDSRLGMIDLNGFDQSIGILSEDYVYLTKAQTSSSFRKSFFEITSATPATLTLTTFSGSRVLPYKFTGAASLDYNQSGTVIVSNAISTTCGELTVSKGSLIFAKDSGWGGGTNVTVKAGATLGATAEGMATVFACAAKPRRSTVDLELCSATADDVTTFGTLQLAAGTAKVNTLRFDGVYQPAGTYGSSASAATHKDDSRFSGPGVLEVRHSTPGPYGLMLIVK